MKHIVMLLTNGFDPDVRVYKEAFYLTKRGFDVTILCWDRDLSRNHLPIEDVDGIHLVRYQIPSEYGSGKKQIKALLKYVKCCKDYLKKHPADYLHCNDIDGSITGFFARIHRTPMVFDMHEFYERGRGTSDHRKLWRSITIFFLNRAVAGLYENNAYLGENYKSVRKKLYSLKNYPDSTLIQALPKTQSDVFRVAYHGVVRGQVRYFTALAEAVKGMDDVRVDINGGGQDLKELLEMQKNYKNVFVHGPYNGITESTRLYSETDALFCCYDPNDVNYQGDGEVVKFYEAIFTGTPMIMTASIGMAKKVVDNDFGVICDTMDPVSIREVVNVLKLDKEKWNKFHNSELSKAPNYSWENAVKVLDKIYK